MTDTRSVTATIESLLKLGAIKAHKDGNHGSQYPRIEEFSSIGIPFLTAKSLNDGKIDIDGAPRLAEDKANKLRLGFVQSGDVLLSHNATIGRVAIVPEFNGRLLIGTSLTYFRLDQSIIIPGYLAAFFLSKNFQDQLKSVMSHTTRNQVPITAQRLLSVVLPPITAQKAIATVLGAFDDRIALLRETNATLEAIAQALFKSWFVDFDPVRAKQQGCAPEGMDEATAALFPDSFEESELGLVPSGWRVGALEDCCERVESGGTPKRSQADYWNGDISWLTSGEVRNPIVFESKEKITNLGVKESSAKIWPTGTTVIAMYGATAGEVCILANPATANQACCGLIPSKNARSFLFFCTRRERKDLASKSSGSAQQNLNKGLVCNHKIVLPSANAVAAYEQVAGELLNGWIENERQAQTLATLRDTLLPRLISGQLRLPEAEALTMDTIK